MLAAVAFLWAVWQNRSLVHPEVRLDRWHHLYLGLALACAGVALRKDWLLVVAAIVTVDDAVQHVVQVTADPDYRSPLWHLFARLLWPLSPVQWLVGILDEVFK